MLARRTLDNYITECRNVYTSGEDYLVESTLERIIYAVKQYIPDIKEGLAYYRYAGADINDYYDDLLKIADRLQVELDILDSTFMSDKHHTSKIFISHASADKYVVTSLVELLNGIGLTDKKIVCTSVTGYGIPLDENIYNWLRTQFLEYDLHVFFVLSENYYKSAACLNEMGACWLAKKDYTSFLVPKFRFEDISGAIDPRNIAIKLDSDSSEIKHRLNELKNNLVKEFALQSPTDIRWEEIRDKFIAQIHQY